MNEPEKDGKDEKDEKDEKSELGKSELGLLSAGQRRVNLIWEMTQSIIAIIVVSVALAISWTLIVIRGNYVEAALQLVSNAFFLIVGFYFGRTNHQRTGGVGPNEFGR